MISPITVATQGLLNSPLSVAAVRGHLSILVAKGGGSSAKGKRAWQEPHEYDVTPRKLAALRAQLLNEDDEIITIVMTAMEVLQ